MNPICEKCNYYKQTDATRWNLRPTYFGDEVCRFIGQPVRMLILIQPKPEDFTLGLHMATEPGEWLRAILQTLQVPFAVDSTVRCIGAKSSPGAATVASCKPHWAQTLAACPKDTILILVGLQVAKDVLQRKLTLSQFKDSVWDYEGHPTVVLDSPFAHSAFLPVTKGGTDLRAAYTAARTRLEQLLAGCYQDVEDIEYDIVSDPASAVGSLAKLKKACKNCFGLDIEARIVRLPIHHPDNGVLSIGICGWTGRDYKTIVYCCRDWTEAQLGLFCMELRDTTLIGTNFKFDLRLLRAKSGINLQDHNVSIHDTMFLSYIRDQSKWGNGLENLAMRYLGIPAYKVRVMAEMDLIRRLITTVPKTPVGTYHQRLEASLQAKNDYWKGRTQDIPEKGAVLHYGNLGLDFLHKYQALDAWAQFRLWREHFYEVSEQMSSSLKSVYRLMIEATWTLIDVETCGMPVDVPVMRRIEEVLKGEIDQIKAWLDGHPFTLTAGLKEGLNVNSVIHMDKVVKSSHTYVRFLSNATNLASVDKKELKRLCGTGTPAQKQFWSAVNMLRLKRNRLSKFITPYADNALDGFLHTTYSLTRSESSGDLKDASGGIESGRIASSGPSFHVIVKDNVIRRAYPGRAPLHMGARPGPYYCLEADFSSAEPVVLGLLTNCANYLKVFHRRAIDPLAWDADLYQLAATRFWSIPYPEHFWERNQWGDLVLREASEKRGLAKSLVLATTYLQTPRSASQLYGMPEETAEMFNTWFWQEHPEILEAVNKLIDDVIMGKTITTATGRQATFELQGTYTYDPEIHSKLPFTSLIDVLEIKSGDDHVFRKAWNFLTQATASDCCVAQLVKLQSILRDRKVDWFYICNVVHDSIWALCHKSKLEDGAKLLRGVMRDPRTYLPYGWNIRFPNDVILLDADVKAGPSRGEMKGMKLYEPSRS